MKRRKSLKGLYDWFFQAAAAVKRRRPSGLGIPGKDFIGYDELLVPIVVARQDGGRWLAILDLDDFLTLTAEELKFHVEQKNRRELDALPTSD